MNWYNYSGVMISSGSGDPSDGDFVQLYESSAALPDWTKKEIDLFPYAGEIVYIAFNYRGDFSHAWLIDAFCVSSSFLPGDINEDGTVDISDVILCLRMSIGLPVTVESVEYPAPYENGLIQRADINLQDGVNISDVILILRRSIGLD